MVEVRKSRCDMHLSEVDRATLEQAPAFMPGSQKVHFYKTWKQFKMAGDTRPFFCFED